LCGDGETFQFLQALHGLPGGVQAAALLEGVLRNLFGITVFRLSLLVSA
jgi:hypothetical protein